MQKKFHHHQGQSTVEFLFTLIMALGIIFLFINLALNTTAGYMGHYATFMSSRTYLVMDQGSNDVSNVYTFAEREARQVFNSYAINRFGVEQGRLHIMSPQYHQDRRQKLYVGVSYTFKQRLSVLTTIGSAKPITLVSESFLGKEPARIECKMRVCASLNSLQSGSYSENNASCGPFPEHITVFDDGC